MTYRRMRNSGLVNDRPAVFPRGRALGKAARVLLFAWAWGPTTSHAQESQAEALFAEGRARLLARDYAQACPLFAESLRLDPASGAALNLALCQERQGKLASAWNSYQTALLLSASEHKPAQERVARQRLEEIDGRRSRVIVSIPGASNTPGLVVELDGARIKESEWGTAMPVDGGRHTLRVSADGKSDWQCEVVSANELDTKTIEVPTLAFAPSTIAAPALPAEARPSS